jgi:hypothetical protein
MTTPGTAAAEVGHVIRRSLGDWGRTVRLCIVGVTTALLWCGVQLVEHTVADPTTSVCVSVTGSPS